MLATLVESIAVGNSRHLMFIDNLVVVRFYKNQWWLLEVWDVHLISLVMQHTQFDHTCKKIKKPVIKLE
jgi:hypothetical protein